MGKLGDAARGAASALELRSKFAAAFSGAVHYEDAIIPRLNLRCRMRLVAHDEALEIEAELARRMGELGLPLEANALAWEAERARRYLAIACRDAEDVTNPVGTVEEWGRVDQDILGELWRRYADLRERLDFVEVPLTSAERAEIEAAIAKKNAAWLRSLGCSRLCTWLLSTDGLPLPSLTPTSGSGGSSTGAPGPSA